MSENEGHTHSPSVADLASAAEARIRTQPKLSNAAQLIAEHDKRQTFRRMIDPGITRPNSIEQARASLKILNTIATNLLREPENDKYRQFKTHNPIIKKNLIEAKGALEYAIELGFRPAVVNWDPIYVWDPKRIDDLKVGASILEEFTQLEKEKAEREQKNKIDVKAHNAMRVQQAKLEFMDDRINKRLADEREKQRMAARAQAAAQSQSQPRNSMSPDPGSDQPPAYSRVPMGPGRTLADPSPVTPAPEEGLE